jgi:hypothetical protein
VNPALLPAAACLFLDVDGKLVELGPTSGVVEVDGALQQLLQCKAAGLFHLHENTRELPEPIRTALGELDALLGVYGNGGRHVQP